MMMLIWLPWETKFVGDSRTELENDSMQRSRLRWLYFKMETSSHSVDKVFGENCMGGQTAVVVSTIQDGGLL